MEMQRNEFYAHNSPWTEMYDMHCQREDAQSTAEATRSEQEPTHHALDDVYNRDDTADTYHKRV